MKQKISLFICVMTLLSVSAQAAITICLTVPSDVTTEPYIFAWDNQDRQITYSWPGEAMKPMGNHQYSYTFKESVSYANIIFNQGG